MSTGPLRPGNLLSLYAMAPHLGADDLRRGVCRVLTADDPRPGPWPWPEGRHGQILRHAGVTAEVAGSWDGPHLRLRCAYDSPHASRAGELLADIAAAAERTAPGRPIPRPAIRSERNARSANGYRAWRAMMRQWDVPTAALAEITTPGRLDPVGHPDHGDASQSTFVFDHTSPPQPPPGWLLRSWFFPDAGTFHCSQEAAPPGRLRVRTPRTADREQAAALLAAWRAVTAELDAQPDLTPDALTVPPRAFVFAHRSPVRD